MKFLILFSYVIAAVLAQHQPWYGPQHVPVIGPNGVPLDTAANQQATRAHLEALAAAGARTSNYAPAPGQYAPAPGQYAPAPGQYNAPANQYSGQQTWRHTPPAYQTTNVIPAIGQNGVPLDTPEVEAAKRVHFAGYQQSHAALQQAAATSGPGYGGGQGGHYRRRRSIYGGPWAYGHATPVIGPNGVPLDTPEVQAAKAAHIAAHAEASSRTGALSVIGAPLLGYGYGGYAAFPQHIPTIDGNGVPVDTPEVQHARAAHLAALNAAAARNGVGLVGAYSHSPWSYAPALIGPSGAPVDTPEVQAAKAAHFAAHAAARGHHY